MKILYSKIVIIIFCIFSSIHIKAQSTVNLTNCLPYSSDRSGNTPCGNPNSSELKILRINVHYFLRNNGTGNFTETGDNNGGTLTGYDFSRDVLEWINGHAAWNSTQNIPAMNTIPTPPKNYQYVLDAVYFHRDNSHFNFNFSSSTYNTYKENPDHVMQVLLTDVQGQTSVAGYASSLGHTSTTKYTKLANVYSQYVAHAQNPNAEYGWTMHSVGGSFQHELGHLLGLSHTVRYNNGPPCPYSPSCDDGCNDTVSAYDMLNTYNATHHPACGWNQGNQPGCSNNVMDYAGANALSPCQIDIIHCGLGGGLKQYRVCDAVINDKTICHFGYPQIAYYGNKVTIEACGNNPTPTLHDNEQANIYFSNEVEFHGGFEVRGEATFEVFHVAACPS